MKRGEMHSWQADAAHRLRSHVMRAVTRGRDYAPDQTYELSKAGQVGPISAQIATILQRHADLWAADAQQLADLSEGDALAELNAAWRACMAEADAEIDRFLASRKTRAA